MSIAFPSYSPESPGADPSIFITFEYYLSPSYRSYLPLLAAPSTGSDASSAAVYCGICLLQKALEAAGRAFYERYERPHATSNKETSSTDENPTQRKKNGKKGKNVEENEYSTTAGGVTRGKGQSSSSSRSAKGPSSGWLQTVLKGENLYDILEVDEAASSEKIRKQYRLMAVRYHPDKNTQISSTTTGDSAPCGLLKRDVSPCESTSLNGRSATKSGTQNVSLPLRGAPSSSEENEAFLKIQEAYEILSNDELRRTYDSALPYEDAIPDGSSIVDENSFYHILSPVFRRNAKWSTRKPVPLLGNVDTSLQNVKRFYDFWFQFETWREFCMDDKHDLYDAEDRIERRWMDRENRKIQKKLLKLEYIRIHSLVNLAYSKDPRILAEKQRLEKERNERKDALRREQKKEEEKQQALLESKRKEEEIQQKKIEEEVQAQNDMRKRTKQQIKKWRQCFRQQTDVLSLHLTDYDIQTVALNCTPAELGNICGELAEIFGIVWTEGARAATPTVGGLTASLPPSLSPQEEWIFLSTESKATAAHCIRTHCNTISANLEGGNKSRLEDSFSSFKEITPIVPPKIEEKKENVNTSHAWTLEELSLLAKGLQRFPGGIVNRWQKIADFVATKSTEQVIAKTKELGQKTNLKSLGSQFDKITNEMHAKQMKGIASEKKESTIPAAASLITSVSESEASKSFSEWTREQQQALEAALLKFPASLPISERWTAIANSIPGKSRQQCAVRYKEIRLLISSRAK
ncbi:DnaJ domain-containing protein [Cardiosporidium cionae]|uniref:DnaJ domain-containing protein n=1 Tax=Cardiosporidium cionae TaxID=476202 RepID=A0ABQ7J8P6_9APIC|nr:DnaJ domain-containing protein [Cardiosporidium cionae]|eukprot:KAF8820373.1 DnaJ domain-containing protein [Cardiosporidium cionae]